MNLSLAPVIGLEIHVQLSTVSKMFCGCAAAYGGSPNSRVCPTCLALPGALPVPNARAVELAMLAAIGLDCTIDLRSEFARKSYFYPDLPKGYQITQHARPLAVGGSLALDAPEAPEAPRRVRIRRVHLEEDTARSLHDRFAGATAIDFNRAGVPLIEIVTEPDLRSPAEARAFLTRLRQALQYLGVSDCNMEEGRLRVDANLSMRAPDEDLGIRTELKNLNSFSALERALHWEAERQARIRRSGAALVPETLLWDDAAGEARPMRGKEALHEYRYFPEPDLPPLELGAGEVEAVRGRVPEMPWSRAARLARELGIERDHAEALTATRQRADYFEAVVARGASASSAASWVLGEVLAAANASGAEVDRLGIDAGRLAELVDLVDSGRVSRPAARRVLARMLDTGQSPAGIVAAERLELVSDDAALEAWIDEALAAHPAEAARLRAGEGKLVAFFVGRVMRLSGGRADPAAAGRAIGQRIAGGDPR